MKTLKSLLLVALFATLALTVSANAYYDSKYEVASSTDLKTTIKQMVKSDFVNENNYFQVNNINRIKESVAVTFEITKDRKFKIVSAKCDNQNATNYVKQLLNNSKINVDQQYVGKKFKMDLVIDYRI